MAELPADSTCRGAATGVELRAHAVFGTALFAARDFAAGEVVLSELPLLATGQPGRRDAGELAVCGASAHNTCATAQYERAT
jgi:hypothetical protein